jgi:hypothetical protein
MPTAAKLVAAVMFAIVGWIAANVYVPIIGEGVSVGLFRELTGLIGAVAGWKVMGPSVGQGYRAAIGSGIKTVVVLVFFALLLFSIYEMVLMSMKMRYEGPTDAVLDVFQMMLETAQKMVTPQVLGVLLIGGAIGGAAAERAGQRWP